MKQHLDKFQKLPISSQLSLLVAAILLFTIGITINNALTRQEKRIHAASSNPSTYSTPVPSCSPRPACLDADPKCSIPEPSSDWCPKKSTLGESSYIAQQIYVTPTIYCLGSCVTLPPTQIPTQRLSTPTPTDSPTSIPTNTPISPTGTISTIPFSQTPSSTPVPSIRPCATVAPLSSANSEDDDEKSSHKKKTNGLFQQLLELIKWLIDFLLRLLGLGGTPIPTPIVEPSPIDQPCEPLLTPTQIPNPTLTLPTSMPTAVPVSIIPTSAGVLPTIPASQAGPISRPLPASCTHMVYNQGGQVRGRNAAGGSIVNGTLNQVLSAIGKSGNHVCIQNGNYSLSEITDLQQNVILECESNAIIKGVAPSTASYLIHLKSGSTVKNCTFDHHGKTIFASGEVKNWRVENNYFINSVIAVLVENLTTGVKKLVDIPNNFPTSGWGVIKDNKGLHSKLATFEGTTNLTVTGNYFTDFSSAEFVDFNYNVHNVFFDSNTFINNTGYSISQEVIDMIGGNNYQTDYNTVSNNRIIGNFQTAIRPAKSSSHNTITNNYIEYKPGKAANIAGIYFYGAGTNFLTPKDNKVINNTIIGAPIGIELSGADNNKVTGNNISNAVKGISLVKTSTSTYGASVSPKNNTVSNNTITNADYGIYSVSSPSNTISGNTITSFKIKATQILP